ncbi:MAG: preprotein translocase subunit SecY [Actinobacteria bacterium]|nr:MAG: preprotein translocase subunit SecY [Actinomycetota bacterium]
MLTAIANAFRVPELRRKILFTLGIIGVYRFGCFIPVPGVNIEAIKAQVENAATLGLLNLFSGGALERVAVFSLGIMPYITSSIIMQLLQGVIPKLEQWQKEGESGQRKITQITRYLTLGIALVQSFALLTVFRGTIASGASAAGAPPLWFTNVVIMLSLIAGTALIMWFGELITQRGIGNGMSLLIFASIVSRFPVALVQSVRFGNGLLTVGMIVIVVAVIAAIVYIDRGQRRIPVQYAKRVVGRRVYGGSGTYIPLKINGANVVPIIFASAILFFPTQIVALVPNPPAWLQNTANAIASGPLNWALEFALIVFFTYFYTALVFNPIDLSDNLRKSGGFIPGVRPGFATVRYIENVLNRITLPGALFLGTIAVAPTMLFSATNDPLVRAFGGTSILIMVGVALETMTQIESQLKMRHYDGFFK